MIVTDGLSGIYFMAWKLGLAHFPQKSVDASAGYVVLWLLLMCILSAVELAAIVRDVVKGGRRLPAIAASLLIAQSGLVCLLYWMELGV